MKTAEAVQEKFLHQCLKEPHSRPSTYEISNDTKYCSIVSFKEHLAESFSDPLPDRHEWHRPCVNKETCSQGFWKSIEPFVKVSLPWKRILIAPESIATGESKL